MYMQIIYPLYAPLADVCGAGGLERRLHVTHVPDAVAASLSHSMVYVLSLLYSDVSMFSLCCAVLSLSVICISVQSRLERFNRTIDPVLAKEGTITTRIFCPSAPC